MIKLGTLLSVLNDFEEVVIRYKDKNIFIGQVMDMPRKLPLSYWFYDIALVVALSRKLLIEIERE
jgi:hypothetical protein